MLQKINPTTKAFLQSHFLVRVFSGPRWESFVKSEFENQDKGKKTNTMVDFFSLRLCQKRAEMSS